MLGPGTLPKKKKKKKGLNSGGECKTTLCTNAGQADPLASAPVRSRAEAVGQKHSENWAEAGLRGAPGAPELLLERGKKIKSKTQPKRGGAPEPIPNFEEKQAESKLAHPGGGMRWGAARRKQNNLPPPHEALLGSHQHLREGADATHAERHPREQQAAKPPPPPPFTLPEPKQPQQPSPT